MVQYCLRKYWQIPYLLCPVCVFASTIRSPYMSLCRSYSAILRLSSGNLFTPRDFRCWISRQSARKNEFGCVAGARSASFCCCCCCCSVLLPAGWFPARWKHVPARLSPSANWKSTSSSSGLSGLYLGWCCYCCCCCTDPSCDEAQNQLHSEHS